MHTKGQQQGNIDHANLWKERANIEIHADKVQTLPTKVEPTTVTTPDPCCRAPPCAEMNQVTPKKETPTSPRILILNLAKLRKRPNLEIVYNIEGVPIHV